MQSNVSKERKKQALHVACWNTRTMLNTPESCQPDCHSALIANELSRLNVDITALSEVRFPEEGSVQKQGAVYTLYRSSITVSQSRVWCVSFRIRDSIAFKLENQPTDYSDCNNICAYHCVIFNMPH